MRYIHLEKNGNFFLYDSATYGHQKTQSRNCPLVSFGTWKNHGNKFIELNTADNILYPILDVQVASKSINNDSLSFEILTNIPEKFMNKVSYRLHLKYDGEYDFRNEISGRFKTNLITLKQPHFGVKIKSISVEVFYEPNRQLIDDYNGFSAISTTELQVDKQDNYFIIKIPDLDICYFEYERYEGEYLRILNKNELLWNNEIYLKKD
ncbi:hypothetical protein NLM59_04390 [Weeksellaceae bacterium KMM 9724]|uniref:hypothetical protein n=1 Tax=Profundicola chukchiensis TaxID=2961959 RepID=UPI00243F9D1D|nr:hypothetical protein [Profundicola chukchiensis]MDG4950152.1 hypothetical protein [Profundicola chukchiensis]